MALIAPRAKRPDQVLAVDLGSRATKAVHVQRKGETFSLTRYAFESSPSMEKGISPEVLGAHLKKVAAETGNKTKSVVIALGVADCFLKHAELPQMPVTDMRALLKGPSQSLKYLQDKYEDFRFDCFVLPPRANPGRPGETSKPSGHGHIKTLVSGAKRSVVEAIQNSCKAAGLMPLSICPGMIGPTNAFELAENEAFSKEVVALVDIGFKHSTISILLGGELALYRFVAMGGERITAAVAEALGSSVEEAEGIKVGLAEDERVQAAMLSVVSPLGRELRASIDYFEHQHDKTVSQVYVSGGSARSQLVLDNMQSELMVTCKAWSPVGFMSLALPPDQMGEIEQVSPQLAVSVGAAMSVF